MLKIFQTGDNHIGLKYASHEKASILASTRINAFENMVSIANREKCDLFVITGDLFENTYGIPKRDVKTLLDMLACFNGTVIVLPGNHDYYDKDAKVWQYFKDVVSSKDNIMLLTEYRPYSLTVNDEDVMIYPAHCTSLHSEPGKNNLDWIKKADITPDNIYKIGIAHGAVQGETIDNEGQYFLMTRSEFESIHMDVWLIGHTHVPFPANLTEDFSVCENILNAGTHVQTDVSCNTEGYCFVVEIDDNKEVRARKIKSGNLYFCRKNITLMAGEMNAILDCEIADIPDNSVVDLIFSGAVTAEEYDNRISEIESRLSRFLEGTYDDNSLSKLISKELIDTEFAETSFSGSLLTTLLDEPKEAQLAYELLRSLKEGR
ncbi:MAG: metallophosphoesterase [Lachnospiraceae bacterium]|nr:metallophosphoesterase [Lachnospiraceae bacterium]